MQAIQALFDAVRQACSANTWSRGVELVRAGAVTSDAGAAGRDDDLTLRVATRGGMISPTVTLYPEDEDWECTCAAATAACEHVAASVIAVRRARKEGKDLPTAAAGGPGQLRYALTRSGGSLAIERRIVAGEKIHRLRSSLDAIASGRVDGPAFAATPADHEVERVLGAHHSGKILSERMPRLLAALAHCADVRLDDSPIDASDEPSLPHAMVVDAPGGYRVFLQPDDRIEETFKNGAVRIGATLAAIGHPRLDGRVKADLMRGRFYGHEQVSELVTQLLPSLRERLPVEIRARNLPETTTDMRPRVVIEVERRGDLLSVLPTLVYGEPVAARIDAGRLVPLSKSIPLRDEKAEERELRKLRNELGLAPGHRVDLAGNEAVAFAEQLRRHAGEIRGRAHEDFYLAPDLGATLDVDGALGDFSLRFETGGAAASDEPEASAATQSAAPADVLRAWREGSSLVALQGGGFATLPHDWLARFGHRVSDLMAARDERTGALPTSALPDLARLCDDLDEPRPARLEGLAPLLDDFDGIPHAELPADLDASLRPYQRAGVDWLCFLREARLGALLADDMGLGKTLQALCALDGRSLVVAPTSLLHNWRDEIERFRPSLKVCTYHGARRSLDADADVVLTSYAILRIDADALCAAEWDAVVIDEAQYIKNPESQAAQAAYRLRARFRVALTGTPVENRLDELWSQLHFLNPGLLGGRRDFQDRYARRIADGDGEAAARMRERIRPFLLRRLKRDVAPELPPRTELVLHCELDESEREVYDAIRAATQEKVVATLRAGGGVMQALEALLRLRQAACHASLVPGQEAESSTKVKLLVERLEQAAADGHKALVFSQWTSLLDLVEPALREAGIDFTRLDGSTRDRGAVVSRFQDDEAGPPVMLVSLKAGGTGLNLTAADHIFLLDPWWNPAVEDQAADRAHRIGQQRPVVIHRLVATGTVEERILALQQSKRALSEVALGEADQAGGLDRDDLLALLD